MKRLLLTLFAVLIITVEGFSQSVPAGVTIQGINEVAAHFKNPPPQYGPTATWGWEGPITHKTIIRDLNDLQRIGFKSVTIEAGYGMREHYLTPGYFKLIKYAVEQAKRRNMRVWIIDEGKYPTGFAGGLFTKKRPDLRMQVLRIMDRFNVQPGTTIHRTLPLAVESAVAENQSAHKTKIIRVQSHKLIWTAPKSNSDWTVVLVGHEFRTSPTRSINNPTRKKDTTNSLMDYLNPAATEQFLDWTHRQYKKYIGAAFGKTVMGFRSDEPAYYMTPWTPGILSVFRKEKGYDVKPYLASFFVHPLSGKIQKIRADYWDVWSKMYRNNFFRLIGQWQARNHLEYVDHIDHDGPETNKMMLDLGRTEGDYFRDMQYLAIPGVDAIWNQVWPGTISNFPKLASSAAHEFGRARAFSESFAAYNPRPDVRQVRWVIDDEMAHGINLFEIMFYMSSASKYGGPHGFMASDSFPAAMRYANRACYLLSQGRPAANIAVIFPTSSLWFGDAKANASTWNIAEALLEQQRDFDFVDDLMLPEMVKQDGNVLKNKSGQAYKTVIIPTLKFLPEKDIEILKNFASAGGHVIDMGQQPTMIEGRTFLHASDAPDLSWALDDPSGRFTPNVFAALPKPDVKLNKPCIAINYIHRHLKDGDIYFFFNRSDREKDRTVLIRGIGKVQIWDANTGNIQNISSREAGDGYHKISLRLKPHEARFIVINGNEQ